MGVREEGSDLIRFRWYNKLKKKSKVFIERKVHHEKWVLASSTKVRCSITQDNVLGFIQGTYKSSEEYLKKNQVFDIVQMKIIKNHLKPTLQTQYQRTAFQLDNSDSIRLSLDFNVLMKNESVVDLRKEWHKDEKTFLD